MKASFGEAERVTYRQKPSTQIKEGFAQARPWVGSHSVPRFELDPHTWYEPLEVVTDLQTLNLSAFRQALAPASALQPM